MSHKLSSFAHWLLSHLKKFELYFPFLFQIFDESGVAIIMVHQLQASLVKLYEVRAKNTCRAGSPELRGANVKYVDREQ